MTGPNCALLALVCAVATGCIRKNDDEVDVKIPFVSVKKGKDGNVEIEMPGIHVKTDKEGGTEVRMPGVHVNAGGDDKQVDVKMPGLDVKTGRNGTRVDIQDPNIDPKTDGADSDNDKNAPGVGITVNDNGKNADVVIREPGVTIDVKPDKGARKDRGPVRKPKTTKPASGRSLDDNLQKLASGDNFQRTVAGSDLLRHEVDENRRAEIAAALENALQESNGNATIVIAKAIGKWGRAESIPALAKRLETGNLGERHNCIDALAAIGDDAAIEPLAARLTEVLDRRKVSGVLKQFGSKVEDAVLQYLKPDDRQTCNAACELLGEIGTEKSLAALEPLTQDRFVKRKAESAMEAIRKRLGQ